jgi:DNA repair ATPase RecN
VRKIRRIELEDFMSHKNTVLDFADGITLLSGDNNCGKSAVVVALEGICGMTKGGWMVRHNAKLAKVTLHLEDEDGTVHVVEWRRKQKTHGWTVNGVKSDRGEPDDLHDVLRMGEVKKKTGKGSFNVHFAQQKDPIFLLNDTGSHRAEFFTTAGDAQLLLAMRQKLKSKQKEATGRLSQCEREIKISKARIEALSDVPEMVKSVGELSERRSGLVEAREKISDMSSMRNSLVLAEVVEKSAQGRVTVLADLPDTPEIKNLDGLRASLRKMRDSESALVYLNQKVDALKEIPNSLDVVDTSSMENVLQQLDASVKHLDLTQQIFDTLKKMPEHGPELANTTNLEVELNSLHAHSSELTKREGDLKNIDGELKSLQESWKDLMKKNPKCPTCGLILDERHLEGFHD